MRNKEVRITEGEYSIRRVGSGESFLCSWDFGFIRPIPERGGAETFYLEFSE